MCSRIYAQWNKRFFLKRHIVLFFIVSQLVLSCALPPEKKPPQPAATVAMNQLPMETPVVNPFPVSQPVPELPKTQPEPLQEVEQEGHTPPLITLSEKTPGDFNLAEEGPIQLDFDQMDIRQVIEIIGDTLGITMVVDPTVAGKVTLRTSKEKPLQKKDLWPLLQLLLNDAGISMEKNGEVYNLKKTGPSMLPGTIGLSTGELAGSDSPQVLQITPLRYISVDSALAVLNPLVQPLGRVISLPNLNVIGIIASPSRLERVNKLLEIVDTDPFLHRGMRLFRLANSKAADVKADLDKILQAISGNAPAYSTIALERINAVLVVAPPTSGFNEVETWVKVLDESSEESGQQIFIYRVRNLEAKDLAATLSNVFKSEKKEDEILQREEEIPPSQEPLPPGALPHSPVVEPMPSGPVVAISAELRVGVVSDDSTNSLIIKASPRDYRQLMGTIYQLDQVPKEVMINAVIAEVKLSEATKYGVDWAALFDKLSVGTNFGIPAPNVGANSPENISSLNGIIVNFVSGDLRALLNLTASQGDVTVLSRPSILVRNNEEASINVGSNEPYFGDRSVSSSDTNFQTQSIQYKETGITLKVTPRINEDGIINMKIEQTLSQLGPERDAGPSFDERKVATSVVVGDGSAIVIGGLIENRRNSSEESIPFLRDLPFVGKSVFTSTSSSDARTELVLIIVPRIVNPQLNNRPLMAWFQQRMQRVANLLNQSDDPLLDTVIIRPTPSRPEKAVNRGKQK